MAHELKVAMDKAGLFHDRPATTLASAYRESEQAQTKSKRVVEFKYLAGRSYKLNLEKHFKPAYKDECTMEELPQEETDSDTSAPEYFERCLQKKPHKILKERLLVAAGLIVIRVMRITLTFAVGLLAKKLTVAVMNPMTFMQLRLHWRPKDGFSANGPPRIPTRAKG